jgi:hypothetical protein
MMMKEIKVNMKWAGAILFLSLAVNFFAVGYFFSQSKQPKKMPRIGVEKNVMGLVEYFPRAQKKEFLRIIHKKSDDYRGLQKEVEAKKFVIFERLSEENINKVKLLDAYEDYQNANNKLQREFHKTMVMTTMKMDQNTRKKSLKRLQKRRVNIHKHPKWSTRKTMREPHVSLQHIPLEQKLDFLDEDLKYRIKNSKAQKHSLLRQLNALKVKKIKEQDRDKEAKKKQKKELN